VDSAEYRDALDQTTDSATFVARLDGLSNELKTVYDSAVSRDGKLARKAQIITEFQSRLAADAPTVFRTPAYQKVGVLPINNAYLSLYGLYTNDVPLLREYWEKRCGSDWRRFLAAARELSRRGDVKSQMRRELGEPASAEETAP